MPPRSKTKIETPEGVQRLRESLRAEEPTYSNALVVCCGTGCLACGSQDVKEAFEGEMKAQELEGDVVLKKSGCRGLCEHGPIVVVGLDNVFYHRVATEDVPEIVSETLLKGETVERLLCEDPATGEKCLHEDDSSQEQKQYLLIRSPLF